MNDNPNLERDIAREAAMAHIPARAKPKEPDAKTFANLTDDAAAGIARLLVAMDEGEKALVEIEAAASAMLEKALPARKLIDAVRASTQK